jgi:hypothetical protein
LPRKVRNNGYKELRVDGLVKSPFAACASISSLRRTCKCASLLSPCAPCILAFYETIVLLTFSEIIRSLSLNTLLPLNPPLKKGGILFADKHYEDTNREAPKMAFGHLKVSDKRLPVFPFHTTLQKVQGCVGSLISYGWKYGLKYSYALWESRRYLEKFIHVRSCWGLLLNPYLLKIFVPVKFLFGHITEEYSCPVQD